ACGVMHGARRQEQREATLKQFRASYIRVLITTDVLGRGVDIPDVNLVFVYDFPSDIETYVHRVGRTGRNGQPGCAVSLFVPESWNAFLARELTEVLDACHQEVPMEL
ncbi:DDX43, partial [Symbiodinium pilosum]